MGGECFCGQSFVKPWFYPKDKLATEIILTSQRLWNLNAIFMQQPDPFLHCFAMLGINSGLVSAMNCTDTDLWAPAGEAVAGRPAFD